MSLFQLNDEVISHESCERDDDTHKVRGRVVCPDTHLTMNQMDADLRVAQVAFPMENLPNCWRDEFDDNNVVIHGEVILWRDVDRLRKVDAVTLLGEAVER